MSHFIEGWGGAVLIVAGFAWLAWLGWGRGRKTISLPELAMDEGHILKNKLFIGVTLDGPAMVCFVRDCVFDSNVVMNKTFAVLPDGPGELAGAIGLIGCVVRNCTLRNIGFVGTAKEIDSLKRSIVQGVVPPGMHPAPDDVR